MGMTETNCDYCGTLWSTEAEAWECSHNDRMAADEADE